MGLFGGNKLTKRLSAYEQSEYEKSVQTFYNTKARTTLTSTDAQRQVAQQLQQIIGNQDGVPAFNYNLEAFIKEGYVQNPHLHSVVNKIVQPLKSIPWYTYRVRDRKALLQYKMLEKHGPEYFKEALHYKELALDMVDGTPMDYIFTEQANPCQTWSEYLEISELYYQCTGNDFTYAPVISGLNYITELYCLPAHVIEIIPGNYMQPVRGYQIAMMGRVLKAFLPENVIHSRMPNMNFGLSGDKMDFLYGLSKMATLGRVVKRSNQSYLRSLYMLINGGPPGFISEDGNTVGVMEPEKLEASYRAKYEDVTNTNVPLFAMGNLKYNSIGTDSAGLQIIETNNADLEDVCRVYDISALLMNTKTVTRDNMTTAEKAAWRGPRMSALSRRRESINRTQVRLYSQATGLEFWCDYDLKGVEELAEDKSVRITDGIRMLHAGLLNGNQCLEYLDMESYPDDEQLNKKMLAVGINYVDNDRIPDKFKGLLSILAAVSPLLGTKIISSLTDDEVREFTNLPGLSAEQVTIGAAAIQGRQMMNTTTDQSGNPIDTTQTT